MAKFKCSVCGYVYDETSKDLPFSSLDDTYVCPVCKAKKTAFAPLEEDSVSPSVSDENPLAYPAEFAKTHSDEFPQMEMAEAL